jgi:hypothetical protein
LWVDGFQKDGRGVKRGREYTVRWAGVQAVRKNIVLTLENRYGVTVQSWETFVNDGEEFISINPKLKPGKGYKLTMSLVGDETELVKSLDLRVRRRVPLGVTLSATIAPVLAAAAILIVPMLTEPEPEVEPEPIDNL